MSEVLHPSPIETVNVALGDRSYDILIGDNLIQSAGEEILARFGSVNVAVVSDDNVARHHMDPLIQSLEGAGLKATKIVVAPGEASKSWQVLETVVHLSLIHI